MDIGELFLDKPDELVLAYAAVEEQVMQWPYNSYGRSTNTIIFTTKRAWLIIRPMKRLLDLLFFNNAPLDSPRLHQVRERGEQYAHHIRLQHEDEVNAEVLRLLKIGYDYSLK